jgi:acetyl esterase/lipase
LRTAWAGALLWCLACGPSLAEAPTPFIIPVEPGKTGQAATASEGYTVYGHPAVPLVWNVTSPTLTAFLPDPAQKTTGSAVIIAPGGAYLMLAIRHEGEDVARWLASRGIAAFVLKYRVAPMPKDEAGFKAERDRQMREPQLVPAIIRKQAPISHADGRAAIKLLRARAAEWHIDPHRIGILGFSAGGGVALYSALEYSPEERPDFAAPIYGAVLGDIKVPADAPPIFLAAAADDPVLGSDGVMKVFSSWRAAGRSAELHLYSKGGHGFGLLPQKLASDHWLEAFYEWMKDQGLAQPRS